VAVLALAVAWQGSAPRRTGAETLPFLAIASIQSRDSASLGPVLRDILATSLSRVRGLRVASNSRLLELLGADTAGSGTVTDAAQRAGANEIIEGELTTAASGLVLTLRRVAIRTGEVVAGYTIRAPDVFALADSATNSIAADLGVDSPPAASMAARTRSSIAYALYEQGLRAFYAGNYTSASQLMYAALGRDSTFAMAAMYAWRASWALSRVEEARRDAPTVLRLAARAPERERLLIEAMIARYFDAPLTETLARTRQLIEKYPDEADGHILFGGALLNAGDWRGAVEAFNRAVAIDSAASLGDAAQGRVCEALAGASEAYLWWDSAGAAERMAHRLMALSPSRPNGWYLLIEPLVRQGRRAEAEAANSNAGQVGPPTIVYYHSLDRDLIRAGRLDELETRLIAEAETAPPEMSGELPWLLSFLLRNQGRLREARELAANGSVPGSNRRLPEFYGPVQLAITSLEAGEPREAARLFLELLKDDRTRDHAGHLARNLSWHMTLAATALAAAGDTASVRAWADSVRRIAPQSTTGRDVRLPHFLDGLLLQRQNRHAEAVDAFRRALFSVTDGYTRINLEMARSLVALQRYPEAIAILQPALRGGVDGSNTYVTHTELHEALAHAFHAAGQGDSARVHYAAVERAWRKADPMFAERYAIARARAQ
jgi:tetratricopeptide (TPR) repeat protein